MSTEKEVTQNEGKSKQPNKINEVPVGVYAYDQAIVDDFKIRFNYTKDGKLKTNNNVYITNSENVFNIIGDIENDNIQFPIISITRLGWSLVNFSNDFQNNSGLLYGYMDDEKTNRKKQVRLQAIPINIDYQIDIWTQNRIDNDILARELVWYYYQNPQMQVKIPHGLNVNHVFNVFFELDVTDNSDISEHNSRGRYYRQTFGLTVDDAYLWKSSVKNVPIIDSIKYSIYDGKIDESMFIDEDTIIDYKKKENNEEV